MANPLEFLSKGDVIAVPFPFSDTSATKRRPALVIAESDPNNLLVCPITSKSGRVLEIQLKDEDFQVGRLTLSPCYIRPNIIATVAKSNVIRWIGRLKDPKMADVTAQIVEILQKPPEPPPASKVMERGKPKNS